jgi:hypothetical protein
MPIGGNQKALAVNQINLEKVSSAKANRICWVKFDLAINLNNDFIVTTGLISNPLCCKLS